MGLTANMPTPQPTAQRLHALESACNVKRLQCLERVLPRRGQRIRVRCLKCGAEWPMLRENILKSNGRGCRSCWEKENHDKTAATTAAVLLDGFTLTGEAPRTASERVRWRCRNGHAVEATVNRLRFKKKHGCAECARAERTRPLAVLRALAEKDGYQCLSAASLTGRAKMIWQCADTGHAPFPMSADHFTAGQRCPACAKNQKKNLLALQTFARARGWECLAEVYVDANTPVVWRCEKRHEWHQRPSAVMGKAQSRCPTCHREQTMWTIDDCDRVARDRSGICETREYKNASSPMMWRCSECGRGWETTFGAILQGQWCPHHTEGRGERLVRDVFERLTGEKFRKCRPAWLQSPENPRGRLELDGFSATLQCAFEYQGQQHFAQNPYYGIDADALTRLQRRDEAKRELCAAHGVVLIEIRQLGKYLAASQLEETVRAKLKQHGMPVPGSAPAP